MKSQPNEIFIYCNDPSHPQRKPVGAYRSVPSSEDRWHRLERPRYTDQEDSTFESVVKLTEGLSEDGPIPLMPNPFRHVDTLRCPLCVDRPQTIRREKLFDALDQIHAQRVTEVTLTTIVAIIDMQTRGLD